MQNFDEKWFVKDSSGVVSGPFALSDLRARARSGSLAADSAASRDGKVWTSVVLVPELRLDCLVLSVEDGFNVLGPFPRDFLDDPDVLDGLPEKGVFFTRDDSLSALRRVRELEVRAAAAEKAKREADAARAESEKKLAAAETARTETAGKLAAAEAAREEAAEMLAKARAECDGASARLTEAEGRLAEAENARLETAKKLAESEASLAAASDAAARTEAAEAELARMKEALKTLAGIGAAAAAPVEIVEPEIVREERTAARPAQFGGAMSGAAALEAQLQKELSMMAGKAGRTPGARK